MHTLKIGFVGCGFMGQLVHLPNFCSLPDCEILALAEVRTELGKQVASKYQIPRLYASHTELAQDPEIEAVVAIMSEYLHPPIAIDLLRAGKHVYIEKPLAPHSEIGRWMVQAERESGKMLMVGYMKRYDPGFELAKEKVDSWRASGEMGALLYAKSHCFAGDWISNLGTPLSTDEAAPPFEIQVPEWLPNEHVPLYWNFQNVYCHDLNLLRCLLGEVDEVEYVDLLRPVRAVRLRFADCIATLEAGWMAPTEWDEKLTLFFEKGRITVALPSPLFRNRTASVKVERKGELVDYYVPPDWAFRRAAAHFIECVRNNNIPRSSAEDSLKDLELVERIFKKL